MAPARDESAYGTGGKFKKRPFQRSKQSTPYDRPPTALRSLTNIRLNNNNNNGWLSKLVDPAQRLILSGAHRLFSSVFRKRLPPPPSLPPEQEENHEATDNNPEQVSANHTGVEEAIGSHDDLNDNSEKGGLTELEQILKQKTFSRSEIDRLTAVLQSRTREPSVRDAEKAPEVIALKPVGLQSSKEAPLDTPVKENGIANQLISTPIRNSTVMDEDIASPAELAKVYMGSRPSKVSPLMLGMRGQPSREDSAVLRNLPFPSASPAMSLPRSSGHVPVTENGFVTPRYRGRSAIYSMARAPYSRVHSTTTFKGSGLTTDSVVGPSPSHSTWEKNGLTGSKQGSLKRRSTVLDTDTVSVGPIRRIRQKPNLLSSKTLSLQTSGSSLCARESGIADAVQYPSYLLQKPLPSSASKHGLTKMSTENSVNNVPGTTSTPISSKSSEMASRILQQLDKLVSSKEKSPTKLSDSMLNGPALKSLEKVDSCMFMENVHDDNWVNGSVNTPLPGARDISSKKKEKLKENGPTEVFVPKLIPATDSIGAAGIVKDNVHSSKSTGYAVTNSTALPLPQKQHAFQMSAHEDCLEIDDDDNSTGPLSMPLSDESGKDKQSVGNKIIVAESINVEKSPGCSDVKKNDDGDVAAGKGFVFASSAVPSAQPSEVVTLPTLNLNKAAKESSCSLMFSVGEKLAPPKESNVVSPTISTVKTNVDKVPQFSNGYPSSVISDPPTFSFGAPLNSKPVSSTSLDSVDVDATDSVTKVPESDKADNEVVIGIPETSQLSCTSSSPSSSSMLSLCAPSSNSTLSNRPLASCQSSTCSETPILFSSTGNNQSSSSVVSIATTNSSVTSLVTTPAAGASFFKFGASTVPSTSISPISATSGIESTEGKKNYTSFGNSTNSLFGSSSAFTGTGSSTLSATSLAATGTGSSIFNGTLAAFSTSSSNTFGSSSSTCVGTCSSIFAGAPTPITTTGNSSFGMTSSMVANTGSGIFGFNAGASTTATTSLGQASNPFAAGSAEASVNATNGSTVSQTMPTQFGSSALSTSFGLAPNPTLSSGNSMFGSTYATKPFGSFGLSSSPNVFQFGASSASSAASSSVPVFGLTNGSSSSMFPFSSSAIATSPLPVFSNSISVPAFGSAPSVNNDQMNMEDTMAEDTIPASTLAVSAFGQQSVSPPTSFVFGSTAPTGANPFQFGSQQNLATAQNPSPFQPSGSLDFNGGGSFSLGAGGDKSQRRTVKVRKNRKK